jgi:hypothetical protein
MHSVLRRSLYPLALLGGGVIAAACAKSSSAPMVGPAPVVSASIPSPDPRIGLKAGWFDAGQAVWNLNIVSQIKPSDPFINVSTPGDRRLTNSDLAFTGKYVIQGNYSGYQVWDIGNPAKPKLHVAYVCAGSQSDVSVYKDNLAFVSGEAVTGRVDCGLQGVPDSVSKERLRGIRIFDISNVAKPRYIANVQTCRGSHTHTVVEDPNDKENIYIYVSGSAGVRSPNELEGCSTGSVAENPATAQFRIEVIQVPLANPEKARIVNSPRIFQDLTAPPRHAEPFDSARAARQAAAQAAGGAGGRPAGGGGGGGGGGGQRGGPTQCHDITVYPAIGLAGGACGGYGLLLDIRNAANPIRIGAAADSNMSFWHSATFNNDGTKILFTDEWGGGTAPRCRSTDKYEWGANAIFTLVNNQMTFKSYFKMPAAQTRFENCVAHNGSLIPIPGRDVMVQAWYQGGISIFDWTDPSRAFEIAFHDRGPMNDTSLVSGGSWSAYWYNGYIISSEISRGLDIFELVASPHLTQNEIDAAKTVKLAFLNTQGQPQYSFPPSFALSRSYLDQLERHRGLSTEAIASARASLTAAEKLRPSSRRDPLTRLATDLVTAARTATDSPKVSMLANSVRDLANAQQ